MRSCILCGVTQEEKRIIKSKNGLLCATCYQREINSTIYKLPNFGEIDFNEDGKPVCHICGKAYNKVLSHVWQIHSINEKEYKKKYGLELYNGIMSESSKRIAKIRVFEHEDVVIKKNLIENGKNTRFKPNCNGRTADKVSERTKRRLLLNIFKLKG